MKGVTALVEALQQNETLQTLILDTNSIGDEGAEILAKHLSSELAHNALYTARSSYMPAQSLTIATSIAFCPATAHICCISCVDLHICVQTDI